jgi:2,4-dienoyl-CoA reductase-like NADH-dependent reductase (Old Yellow Enzyme family)
MTVALPVLARPGLSAAGVPEEMLGGNPHALTVGEIHKFVAAFGRAAGRAHDAGVDVVEVHAFS